MSNQDIERRQHERKLLRVPAELSMPNLPPLRVQLLDVGVGGVGVVAPINLPLRTKLTIRFAVPDPTTRSQLAIEAQAFVIHSILSSTPSGFVTGLQFSTLSPQSSMAIIRFVKSQ